MSAAGKEKDKTEEVEEVEGETIDIGHYRTFHSSDLQSKHPDKHVVIVSKSTMMEGGLNQYEEYKSRGYRKLKDMPHPDQVAMFIPRRIHDMIVKEEQELSNLNVPTGEAYDGTLRANPEPSRSLQEMAEEYGVKYSEE